MEDKERFKEHIRDLIRTLQSTMLAQRFEIKVSWDANLPEDTAARIHITEPYWTATIEIGTFMYENSWKEKNYSEIGKFLVHEFCHTIIEPIYTDWIEPIECKFNERQIRNAVERQVQLMCFILMGLIPDEEWIPKELSDAESTAPEANASSDREGVIGGEEEILRVRDTPEDRKEDGEEIKTTRLGIPLGVVAHSKE